MNDGKEHDELDHSDEEEARRDERRARINKAANAIESNLLDAVRKGLEGGNLADQREAESTAGLAFSHAVVHYAKELFPTDQGRQVDFAGQIAEHMADHMREAVLEAIASEGGLKELLEGHTGDGLPHLPPDGDDEGNGKVH